jgi:putative ABC transport system permease protein
MNKEYFGLFIKMAAKNLWPHRRKNLATFLAITFGQIGMLLLGGYIVWAEMFLRINAIYQNHQGHISVFRQGAFETLHNKPTKRVIPKNLAIELEKILQEYSEVEHIGKTLTGMGLISNGKISTPFKLHAIDSNTYRFTDDHPLSKKWLRVTSKQIAGVPFHHYSTQFQNALEITPQVASFLGTKEIYNPDDPNNENTYAQVVVQAFDHTMGVADVRIVGHFSTGIALADHHSIKGDLSFFQEQYYTDGVTSLNLYLKEASSTFLFLRKISFLEKKFPEFPLELRTYLNEEVSAFYVGVVSFLLTMGLFFLSVIMVMIISSVIHCAYLNVNERSMEIGLLKLSGFSQKQIAIVFGLETSFLSIISLTLGSIIAKIISHFNNAANIKFRPPGLAYDGVFTILPTPGLMITSGIFIFILSVLTTYFSLKFLGKKKLVELINQRGELK